MRSDGTNPGTLALAGQGFVTAQPVDATAAASTGGGALHALHLLLLGVAIAALLRSGSRR